MTSLRKKGEKGSEVEGWRRREGDSGGYKRFWQRLAMVETSERREGLMGDGVSSKVAAKSQ